MSETTTTQFTTEMPALAAQTREQILASVKQGQDLTLAAVHTITKAVDAFPKPDLPQLAGISAMPDLRAATAYSYDLLIDTLHAQREFALELASAFNPAASD